MVHRRPNAFDTTARKKPMESLDMIDNSPVTIATWIALCGGLRKDEVCGLRWDDVDMRTTRYGFVAARSPNASTYVTEI